MLVAAVLGLVLVALAVLIIQANAIFKKLDQWEPKEEPPALDEDDISMLQERGTDGNLAHPLCSFCSGWHIPPVTAAGCPRIKNAELNKDGKVLKVEYWDTWDRSHTIFPWQVPN